MTAQASAWELEIARALFDEAYYLRVNDDVRSAGVDAFAHFMSHGAREGRRPSETLDLRPYMAAEPTSTAGDSNPLLHFLRRGLLGSFQWPVLNEEVQTVLQSSPPREATFNGKPSNDLIEAEQLSRELALHFRSGLAKCFLSISHTHYLSSTGGVENVVASEAASFLRANWGYIHVCPVMREPWLVDRPEAGAALLVLSINGQRIGTISDVLLAEGLKNASTRFGGRPRLVIHHLMGFDVASVVALAAACAETPIVWIHDFYTLCVDPFLLRNDVEFCRAPELDSNACMVCSKGTQRALHVRAMRRLFEVLQPHILTPSRSTLDIWLERGKLAHRQALVVPLARLALGEAPRRSRPRMPQRVAYLGNTATVKGWPVFRRLAEFLAGDERYAFYRFGYGSSGSDSIIEVPVKVTADDPAAMVRAVRDHEIDVVVNWSQCHETFSFVTCEALAAGAFVVARKDSGNVRWLIADAGDSRGMTLRTETELKALFLSGELLDLQRSSDTQGQVVRTDATALLLTDEHASLLHT
ncbi:hypothetical protein M2165_004843 [Variovorax sp. TBS-050B]|uniref:hypothetical protein n=1 Tax=Variovorax sp. TBS-050B TaxID=2940551 RepID=UPI00247493ED|nr:hypothetical protein [Variovorax sp. TBS-050B]MDH6594954.1 hypothetical protein [Variovorax sp. TBS-050B]